MTEKRIEELQNRMGNLFPHYTSWEVQEMLDEIKRLRAGARAAKAMAVRAFTNLILHGDDGHQKWLEEACEQFLDDGTIPHQR